MVRGLPPLFLPPTSREDLRRDGYLEHSPSRKCAVHLQTFMPSPGFKPRPYGILVRIILNSLQQSNFSGLSQGCSSFELGGEPNYKSYCHLHGAQGYGQRQSSNLSQDKTPTTTISEA
ncbi:hypothetical protein TNCV_5104741 [Trichonephila clavipes]|nr:hypothetical protein TNCV_5104741 [Trichonephila clavipes]